MNLTTFLTTQDSVESKQSAEVQDWGRKNMSVSHCVNSGINWSNEAKTIRTWYNECQKLTETKNLHITVRCSLVEIII